MAYREPSTLPPDVTFALRRRSWLLVVLLASTLGWAGARSRAHLHCERIEPVATRTDVETMRMHAPVTGYGCIEDDGFGAFWWRFDGMRSMSGGESPWFFDGGTQFVEEVQAGARAQQAVIDAHRRVWPLPLALAGLLLAALCFVPANRVRISSRDERIEVTSAWSRKRRSTPLQDVHAVRTTRSLAGARLVVATTEGDITLPAPVRRKERQRFLDAVESALASA